MKVESRKRLHLLLISVGRPLHMILVEPVNTLLSRGLYYCRKAQANLQQIVFPVSFILAISQSIIFANYVIYAILFEDVYNFTEYQVGMAFSPLLAGSVLAVPVVAVFDKVTYQKARSEAILSGTVVAPEKRLFPAMLASFTLPTSLFW
jgi:hypothetical protein